MHDSFVTARHSPLFTLAHVKAAVLLPLLLLAPSAILPLERALLQLGEHALERLARHERLRVLALEPCRCSSRAVSLPSAWKCVSSHRAQQPDRYAAALLVVGEELA